MLQYLHACVEADVLQRRGRADKYQILSSMI